MSQTRTGKSGKSGKSGKGRSGGRPSWQPRRRSIGPVLWGLAVLVGLLAIAAVVITKGNQDSSAGAAAAKVETAPVTVSGTALPQFDSSGGDAASDPAVGKVAPDLHGTGFDGGARAITNDGKPKVVMFLAHWCPHCQREVPLIADWLKGGKPAGVELYSVATSTSAQQANYPPSAWLAREGWSVPVLADSDDSTAAQAYGLTSFPYFVFIDADGKVAKRTSGEIPISQLQADIAQIAKTGT